MGIIDDEDWDKLTKTEKGVSITLLFVPAVVFVIIFLIKIVCGGSWQ